jgi:hypothetical protein
MEMPKPTAAHKQLELLAGDWVGEEIMHPSPWATGGGTATARVRNRVGLDGFAVIQDYVQERGGEPTFPVGDRAGSRWRSRRMARCGNRWSMRSTSARPTDHRPF